MKEVLTLGLCALFVSGCVNLVPIPPVENTATVTLRTQAPPETAHVMVLQAVADSLGLYLQKQTSGGLVAVEEGGLRQTLNVIISPYREGSEIRFQNTCRMLDGSLYRNLSYDASQATAKLLGETATPNAQVVPTLAIGAPDCWPDEDAMFGEAGTQDSVDVMVLPKLIGGIGKLQSRISYPEKARRAGIEGQVVTEFASMPNGTADCIKVVSGLTPEIDQVVAEVVASSRFIPGQVDGKPVKVRMELPVIFALR